MMFDSPPAQNFGVARYSGEPNVLEQVGIFEKKIFSKAESWAGTDMLLAMETFSISSCCASAWLAR